MPQATEDELVGLAKRLLQASVTWSRSIERGRSESGYPRLMG
jgi:hypothetical protein